MTTSSSPFITCHQLIIPRLDKLTIVGCDYDVQRYSKELYSQFNIAYPESINRAVNKRQAEYLAGRYCAQQALAKHGFSSCAISSGRHRNPIWPPKITGSITHTANTALAAVGCNNDFGYIGIDTENILSCSVAQEVSPTIINEIERRRLESWPMPFEKALTFVFSAKESLFKALYPKVGHYFDFTAAEVVSLSEHQNNFTIRLTQTLNQELTKGRLFDGYHQSTEQDVLTVIAG